MPAPANLVHQESASTGAGNLTLTKVNGKNDFATAFTTGGTNVFDYFISNRGAAEWERGTGHMDTTAALVRDTVIQTHAGTTVAINFSTGTKDVTNDVPAADQVRYINGDITIADGDSIIDSSGAVQMRFNSTNNAVNFVEVHNAPTGGIVSIHSAGVDADVALSISSQGTDPLILAVAGGAARVNVVDNVMTPASNALVSLGSTSLGWNALHLSTAAAINFSNGDWIAAHTTPGILTVTSGDLRIATVGTNTLSVARVGGAQTLTGKTIAFADNTLTGVQASLTSGNGIAFSGTTISAESATTNVDGIMEVAEDTEYRANTAGSLALTPAKVWSAAGSVALSTVTSAVAVDMSSFLTIASLAMATNHTLSDPTSPKVGQHFIISVATTTTRTLSLSTAWKLWAGAEVGPYTVTTAEKLYVAGFIESSTGCRVTAIGRTTVIA